MARVNGRQLYSGTINETFTLSGRSRLVVQSDAIWRSYLAARSDERLGPFSDHLAKVGPVARFAQLLDVRFKSGAIDPSLTKRNFLETGYF